ncbi:hypothetical protein [Peptostreptococcus stomatis]|uniref:hypothetical protein n=1 Tax=Peptostreptococcus stomatis TaxID=341694 RepID=UPI0028E32D31|nr:hypothetical protein [Peptostreptococcus stomatis]
MRFAESKFTGSIIKEKGVTFAIILVKNSFLNSSSSNIEKERDRLLPIFGPTPIIFASQDSRGTFRYHGRKDIVKFLANIDPSRIPWKEYTIN